MQNILIISYNFSELKDGTVAISADGITASSTAPMLVVGLVISVIFNVLVGGYVLSQFVASERMENRWVGEVDLASRLVGLQIILCVFFKSWPNLGEWLIDSCSNSVFYCIPLKIVLNFPFSIVSFKQTFARSLNM